MSQHQPDFNAAASAAATAACGAPPADVNSPAYALWYKTWMTYYSAYANHAPIVQQPQTPIRTQSIPQQHIQKQQPPAAAPEPQESKPMTLSETELGLPWNANHECRKMEIAMAQLREKAAGNTTGNPPAASSSLNSNLFAKASQFKPQSKKPMFTPVKTTATIPAFASAEYTTSTAGVSNSNTSVASPQPGSQTQSSPSKKQQPTGHPEGLKRYISKVFSLCTKENRGEVEKYLKIMIETIQRKNALHTTDWDKMSLPPLLGVIEASASPSVSNAGTSPVPSKKRKKFSLELLEDVPPNAANTQTPVAPKAYATVATLGTTTVSTPSSAAASPSLEHLPLHMRLAELEKRESRAKRFSHVGVKGGSPAEKKKLKEVERLKAVAAAQAARGEEMDVIDWDEYTIVGICEKLEKSYLRLTSAPDPSTVRPLPVLRKTLELLGRKWKEDQNYTYICDQFKSLRQDLTVQRIKNDFTVKVYEAHARIALEKGDVGEYNQCQAQLKELYRLGLKGCKDEFVGYRILYMVYTMNRTDQVKILAEISDEEKASTGVSHALKVRMAVSIGDYHSLFTKLYHTAPYMSGYLMDLFVQRERIKSLKTISRAFRPSLSVSWIAKELGYIEPDCELGTSLWQEGVLACFEFLKEIGTPFVDPGTVEMEVRKGKKIVKRTIKKEVTPQETLVDMKAAVPVFLGKVTEVLGKGVDIKGQIH